MLKAKKDRKKRDRQWHLLRMAKRVGLGFLDPPLARKVFRSMLQADGSKCGICGRRVKLVADHHHRLKRHRGRLCHPCNTAIGLLRDSPTLCRWAAMYLEEFEERFED
jgi:Recombination endonuclease VII